MKRIALLLAALFLLPAAPSEARDTNERPRAHLTVSPSDGHRGGKPEPFVVRVDGADPDGVIGEVQVDFGDGVVVYALAACDPETSKPGDPLTMTFNWSYKPGTYLVRARVLSVPDCFSGPFQQSRPDEVVLVVG